MKKQLGIVALCAAMLASSPALLAQPYDQDHDHDHYGHDRDHDHDHDRHPPYNGMHDRGRHEGWYRRGGRLPPEYRGPHYVVTDWRHAHLREPPRGYEWVRSDNGDFLLVAVATGIITDTLLNQ